MIYKLGYFAIPYFYAIYNDVATLPNGRKAYLAALLATIVGLSVYWGDTWYGMLSAFSGVMCVVLVAEKRLSNFGWGLLNCSLYGFISYQNGYFGDMTLNWMVYVPFQFIGFYLWNRSLQDEVEVTSKSLAWWDILNIATATAVAVYIGHEILVKFGGNHPWLDSFNVVLSLVATVLMAKRYAEQWLCWILVNLSGIAMWVKATMANDGEGVATLIMWSAFLLNSLYGYYRWKTTAERG